jgi:hypothetical protein
MRNELSFDSVALAITVWEFVDSLSGAELNEVLR